MANKVVTKVASIKFALHAALQESSVSALPDFAVEAAKGFEAKIEQIDKAAKSSLKSGAPLEWELAEIDVIVAEAKKHEDYLRQMLDVAKVICKTEH